MKKILSMFITVLLFISVPVSVYALDSGDIDFGELSRVEIGDVNTDTYINSFDLTKLRQILLQTSNAINEAAADINYDGSIDIIDLVRLKKKLSGVTTSLFNTEAGELKASIMNAKDSISAASGSRTVYVSAEGSTLELGTQSSPISYETFIKRNPINGTENWLPEGSAVLFKRGDVFRGIFIAESGISYGAYGEGNKPMIYGSAQNYSTADWTQEGNIYSLSLSGTYDAGIIVFNDGEAVGYKRASLEEVTSEFDFYHDSENGVLYLYLNNTPSEYKSIEIGTNKKIINIPSGASDITIENLSLKYSGAHGIYAVNNTSDITVKNCEISYVGGSYITDYDEGTTRYGNGIEFWKGCENILVENNWIHNIYDSGITHQGSGTYTVNNVAFRNNLIEYCGLASIEYWLWYDEAAGEYNSAENVTYANNIMRYAGYGFGGDQRDNRESSAHIYGGGNNHNVITGFTISGNLMDLSTGDLLNITSKANVYPTLSGNTYAQGSYLKLGTFSVYFADYRFDLFADDTVKNVFGDKDSKVYWY